MRSGQPTTRRLSQSGSRPTAVRWASVGCSGSASAKMPFRLGVNGARRFIQSLSKTEPFHKSVDGPHWYLVAVARCAECQGQGLGSALVEVGTSRADEAGVPCYLETGTQSNIDFYTKRGFEIVGQTEYLGHTLTGMVRQPREQSTP